MSVDHIKVQRDHGNGRVVRVSSVQSDSSMDIPTFLKEKALDANAQIIRSSLSSALRDSETSFFSAMTDNFDVDDKLTLLTIEEPELPTILSELYASYPSVPKGILQCMVMVCFVFLTWGLAFRGHKIGANLAAASTSTVASVVVPDLLIFASMGSYAGMTNVSSPTNILYVSLLTSISGIILEYFGLFAGRGGRLGTSAFVASSITLLLLYVSGNISWQTIYDPDHTSYSDIDGGMVLNTLCCNMLGAGATYLLRRLRPLLSPVTAGNAVSMILIVFLDSFLLALPSAMAAEAAGCILQGSFVAMSSYAILPSLGSFMVTGCLSGSITLVLYPLFPHGVGGKRGFMAFIAVVIFEALSSSRNKDIDTFAKVPLLSNK